jgi:cell wall-associated NlpC family hydrolase
MGLVGTPYRWGGDDPMTGLDCSGASIYILQSEGILPKNYDNTAQGLYRHFKKKENGLEVSIPQFGDLAFYGKLKSKLEISHVAYVVDTYRALTASGGNSKVNTAQDAADKNAYLRILPINYRKDLVSIIRPERIDINMW